MMMAIGLLLVLLQEPSVSKEANALVSRLGPLLADPVKNADELDRRYHALKRFLEEHREFKSRPAALGWMAELAMKTSRYKHAFEVYNGFLETPALSPNEVRRWAVRAHYAAKLTANPSTVTRFVRATSKKHPESILAKIQDRSVESAKVLGRRGATVSLPTLDGNKFSWRTHTKDKIVLLCFTASGSREFRTSVGTMSRWGRLYKDAEDVALIVVTLDRDKTQLEKVAPQFPENWTVLCDYKGYESPAARAYGVTGVPATVFLDGQGRIRKGPYIRYVHQDIIADLRLEGFWVRRRGNALPITKDEAAEPSADPAPEPAKPVKPKVRWIFHLKSGGKLKVVSYAEQGGIYSLTLTLGSTSISKDAVDRIVPFKPKGE